MAQVNPAFHLVEEAVLAGQHDDRNILELGIALDDGKNLVTIHLGQYDIQHDQVGPFLADLAQGLQAVARLDHLVAVPGQGDGNDLSRRGTVFHHPLPLRFPAICRLLR